MIATTPQTLQDQYLCELKKERVMLTVFLMNGYQMRGTIVGYDSFVVLLICDGKQMLIYKHAISTLIPYHPVKAALQD